MPVQLAPGDFTIAPGTTITITTEAPAAPPFVPSTSTPPTVQELINAEQEAVGKAVAVIRKIALSGRCAHESLKVHYSDVLGLGFSQDVILAALDWFRRSGWSVNVELTAQTHGDFIHAILTPPRVDIAVTRALTATLTSYDPATLASQIEHLVKALDVLSLSVQGAMDDLNGFFGKGLASLYIPPGFQQAMSKLTDGLYAADNLRHGRSPKGDQEGSIP